jgi:hypothetical protein
VAWKDEAWLQALFAFEAALLLAVVLSRKRHYLLQGSLFVFIVALIAASETLNSWAKANWKRFSTQNYFDPRGVFAGVVYGALCPPPPPPPPPPPFAGEPDARRTAGPLLCIMVVHVVVILKVRARNTASGLTPARWGAGRRRYAHPRSLGVAAPVLTARALADLVVKVKRHELGVEARARRDKKDE